MLKTAAVPPAPSASVRIGEQRVGRAAHQPARRVANVHDPALEHWSSRSHAIGVRLEAGHAAPPAAAEECGQRSERLPPGPAPRRRVARTCRRASVLRLQIGQQLVALRDRE